jgi:hypothetical protein
MSINDDSLNDYSQKSENVIDDSKFSFAKLFAISAIGDCYFEDTITIAAAVVTISSLHTIFSLGFHAT